ncbi:MAG: nitroreductase/quinone reductase family protein [Microthrixaceae bacterium]
MNRVIGPLARSGMVGPLPVGVGLVVLRTTGRRTGLEREVPLLAARVGDRVLVGTVRTDSQWFRNLAVDPDPAVWLCGSLRPAGATVRTGPVRLALLELVGDGGPGDLGSE